MQLWPPPRQQSAAEGDLSGLGTLVVSGTTTIFCALTFLFPSRIAAQSTGTLQVVATVTNAGAAWAGLAGARLLARKLGYVSGPLEWEAARHDAAWPAYVRLEASAGPAAGRSARPAILIQYLQN